MVDIVFVTPGSMVDAKYLTSLLDTIKVLDKKGISWKFITTYTSHVAMAREQALFELSDDDSDVFIPKFDYGKLIWIDSDIVFKPEDVIKLYESDKDIVSGCYLMSGSYIAAFLKEQEPLEVYGLKGDLIPIKVCGFGFIAIKKGVFESIQRPVFQDNNGDGILVGEDATFCRKAIAAGYTIWLDESIFVGHIKKHILSKGGTFQC